MGELEQRGHDLVGDFAGADDLLWTAQTGELARMGPVRVARSGRVGPLVEILLARREAPDLFATVTLQAPFAITLDDAIGRDQITGTNFRSRAGAFPLRRYQAEGDGAELWALWASRAEQAAVVAGFPKPLAAAIIGAMGEFQDNVFRHSGKPDTGLVVYAGTDGAFEIVVADAGIGVLASLQTSPDYACLQDAGAALKVAVEDGNSRFGRASGNGYGIGQVFRVSLP